MYYDKNDIKVAGAVSGFKGDEHNNFILTLTPTIKISLKRAFFALTDKFKEAEAGFEAFDCFSGQMENVGNSDISNMSSIA